MMTFAALSLLELLDALATERNRERIATEFGMKFSLDRIGRLEAELRHRAAEQKAHRLAQLQARRAELIPNDQKLVDLDAEIAALTDQQ